MHALRSNAKRLLCASGQPSRSFWGEVKSMVALGEVPDSTFLKQPRTVTVIGAPMTFGQPLAGTDEGPRMIRDAGLHKVLSKLGWRIEERGDLKFSPPSAEDPRADAAKLGGKAKSCFVVGRANEKLAKEVYKSASEEKMPLVLGGDHSLAIGTISGVLKARPNTGIVWVDAHADLNTPATSPSGNMHGMPLGIIMQGLVELKYMPGFEWLVNGPRVKPEDIVYIGLRDIDDQERGLIRQLGIKTFTMRHVDMYGIGKVMEMTLDHLLGADSSRPMHLSYDVDAIDPGIAPSTGTIVRGGLTYREAHYIAESVSETGQLGSMDMVEVNPSLVPGSGASETADAALGMIASALGSRIL